TLNDAAKAGHVDDVPSYRSVLGLRVKKGAFTKPEAVAREDLSAIGADAVTVATPDTINLEDRFPQLAGAARLSQVHGTKVMTASGEVIGTIRDLVLDEQARGVTGYLLETPLWDRLQHREPTLPADRVVKIGEGGIMIVDDSTKRLLEVQ
ncbi:MAG TPA: PRC-barrel domain-containing protein, partial [Chloroflexota bacterium]|nr:PRC-barrel domain-containing protein [Chloroflexota bacterium]